MAVPKPLLAEFGIDIIDWRVVNLSMAENIQQPNETFKIDYHGFIAQFAGSRLIEEEVDGESFLMLTQSDLIQHLGFRLGPAVKLANAILLIKSQVCSLITKVRS